jgi:hypothetical protein
LALLVACSAPSYSSDPIYGYSSNAAANGLHWSMSEQMLGIPPTTGLDISGVIYRYTAVKNRPDDFTVTIRNENPLDGGYIFSETDDWSGKSGQTITRAIPVGYSPIEYWGDGEITMTGTGSVVDPQVVYTYRFIEPEVEQTAPPLPTLYSALDDPYAQTAAVDREKFLKDDEEVSKDDEEVEKEDMEKALATGDADLNMAIGQTGMIAAMNPITMHNYYAMSIPGGVYQETVILQGGEIKDNRRAFRSMANDRLHTEMVGSQWK